MKRQTKTPIDMIAGTIHRTNECGHLEVVKYHDKLNVDVMFKSTRCTVTARSAHIRTGSVKDPMKKAITGVGFIGVGSFIASKNMVQSVPYKTWCGMLRRCYCKKMQGKSPTYIGCTVHPDWHNFQNFAKWYDENYIDGYQIDKDLLRKGNKIYSPDTCRMIPSALNKLLSDCAASRGRYPQGVSKQGKCFVARLRKSGALFQLGGFSTPEQAFEAYKPAKERHVKEEASRYFENGAIQQDIYDALMKWEL